MSIDTRRLLTRCYLAALIVWAIAVLAGFLQTAFYARSELGANRSLTLDDFTLISIKDYENEDDPQGVWFVSTDSDPQMIWEGDAYLNRVVLKIHHAKPGNGVELYYRKAGQTEFSEHQVVYARQNSEGWYVFDLRGVRVSGLRIDPDSLGGVPTRFDGVELNAPWPALLRCVPTAGQALILIVFPLLVGAALRQIEQWRSKNEKTDSIR